MLALHCSLQDINISVFMALVARGLAAGASAFIYNSAVVEHMPANAPRMTSLFLAATRCFKPEKPDYCSKAAQLHPELFL